MPAAGTIEYTSTIQLSSTVLKKLLDRRISPSFAFLSSSLTAKGDTGKPSALLTFYFKNTPLCFSFFNVFVYSDVHIII